MQLILLFCFVVWRDSTTNVIILLVWLNPFINPSVASPWVISQWYTETLSLQPFIILLPSPSTPNCTGGLQVDYPTSSSKISQALALLEKVGVTKPCNFWGNVRCLAILVRVLVLYTLQKVNGALRKHLTILPAAVNYLSYVYGCQRCFIVAATGLKHLQWYKPFKH